MPERDRSARRRVLALALPLALSACAAGAPPPGLAGRSLCERALATLAPDATGVVAEAAGPSTFTLAYARADGSRESLACAYVAEGDEGGLRLTRLAGPAADGELSPSALFLLQTFALAQPATPPAARLGPVAYLAQQLVNAIGPAAIYALLALGYSLLYGLIGRVNLAFGEFCAFGTLAALAGGLLAGTGASVPAIAIAAIVGVVPLGVALGAATHRLILRPLARRTPLAFLVATLGLSIALSEGLRLFHGTRTDWFPADLARTLPLWSGEGGGTVTVSSTQLLVAGLALAVVLAVVAALRRTAFGRAWRACADDMGAAALLGVDIDRVVRRSAVLAATCAALSGAAVSLQYGITGPEAGMVLGFKALTAAVVGGIGSPAGAAVGGVVIGVAETLWAAYLSGEWRDVAIFGLLAAALVFRPYGLLGRPLARDNPMLWRGRDGP